MDLKGVIDVLNDPTFTTNFWGWATRWASAAGIIGGIAGVLALVLAVGQLRAIRRDQKRIADELTMGPRLVLYFQAPYAAPESTEQNPVALLRPTWPPGSAISEAVELWVSVGNRGERTARNVRCNVNFPTVVKKVEASPHDVRQDAAGQLYVITNTDNANPGTGLHYPMRLFVERIDAFEGVVSASLEDRPAYTWKFRVKLAYAE